MPVIPHNQAEPPLILTLDIGSSSTRALLFDRQGREVADSETRLTHALQIRPDGGVEEDPAVVLERVTHCIDGVLAAAGPLAEQIGAVALATYVSNLLGISADGRPLTPIYLYADTRNAADAAALRTRLDEAAILERTGCPLRSSYLPARLRWLQRTQPEIVRQVWRWISLGEYLLLQFAGELRVSLSVASWSGLLNRHTLQWDAALLVELGLDAAHFAPLVDRDAPTQGLRKEYARRWPTLARIPWFPAIGDGAAANVGSSCVTPARIALTIGTTGALRAITPTVAQIPWGLWCYRLDRQRALLGGATSEGGNVFAWLNQTLRLDDVGDIEQALQAGEPDGHGLTLLPFLAGERSPGWSDHGGASIVGLKLSSTPLDILRAGLEAVAYRFALIARLLDAALPGEQHFVTSGGALHHSPAWAQLLADVLGQPLYAAAEQEATSRGVALAALAALGLLPELEKLPLDYTQVYTPNMGYHERYAAAIVRQQRLYASLSGF